MDENKQLEWYCGQLYLKSFSTTNEKILLRRLWVTTQCILHLFLLSYSLCHKNVIYLKSPTPSNITHENYIVDRNIVIPSIHAHKLVSSISIWLHEPWEYVSNVMVSVVTTYNPHGSHNSINHLRDRTPLNEHHRWWPLWAAVAQTSSRGCGHFFGSSCSSLHWLTESRVLVTFDCP